MPDEDLRRELAKAELYKRRLTEQDSKSPLENPKIWQDARAKMASGWTQPDPRFYIVISPTSLVSTPEKLQQIAKMTSAPKIFETTYTGFHGGNPREPQMQEDGKPQEVSVGEISWEELKEIKSKTDYDVALFVWINNEVRGAILVKSFK
jgi:hypothetical protein